MRQAFFPESQAREMFIITQNGKYGYIDHTGKMIIEPKFDFAWNFTEVLARVMINGNFAYIDKRGNSLINPQYDDAVDFKEGLARVRVGSKWGYIGQAGNIVIKPQFDLAEDFSEGLAGVSIGKKLGYVNPSGAMAIEPQFDLGWDFKEGLFGREYVRHLQSKNLKLFNVSSHLKEMADRNIFALRYAVTHDIFHVLLGFDPSYAGEIGVLAFAAEQNYSQSLKISLLFARILQRFPLL